MASQEHPKPSRIKQPTKLHMKLPTRQTSKVPTFSPSNFNFSQLAAEERKHKLDNGEPPDQDKPPHKVPRKAAAESAREPLKSATESRSIALRPATQIGHRNGASSNNLKRIKSDPRSGSSSRLARPQASLATTQRHASSLRPHSGIGKDQASRQSHQDNQNRQVENAGDFENAMSDHFNEMIQTLKSSNNEIDARNKRILTLEQKLLAVEKQTASRLETQEKSHMLELERLRTEHRNETDQLRNKANQEKWDLEQKCTELKGEKDLLQAQNSQLEQDLREHIERLQQQINVLESDTLNKSSDIQLLQTRVEEAEREREEAMAKLYAEQTERRRLNNELLDLKGNIRVFCRVRPPTESEASKSADIRYPDAGKGSRELVVHGPERKSAMGTPFMPQNPFTFDRVFGPEAQNSEVFEEISQLVQSVIDGFKVCIFCYGQTGSGKTFTMFSQDGMMPSAIKQIYETTRALKETGWEYKLKGQFVEVYNEELNDLLDEDGKSDDKKLVIKQGTNQEEMTIDNAKTFELDSPEAVQEMLAIGSSKRKSAATKANSRSSRSHAVFILRLEGIHTNSGERRNGILNLVDLAGSERLSHSGAQGDRLKETQSINKSLSSLGDVISALGSGKRIHVPYRNSTLTYLLQSSLGGNSKTLMFVMASPLAPHIQETLSSLGFAAKVNTTHIGTAKN